MYFSLTLSHLISNMFNKLNIIQAFIIDEYFFYISNVNHLMLTFKSFLHFFSSCHLKANHS